jgi:hypothetical protein
MSGGPRVDNFSDPTLCNAGENSSNANAGTSNANSLAKTDRVPLWCASFTFTSMCLSVQHFILLVWKLFTQVLAGASILKEESRLKQ